MALNMRGLQTKAPVASSSKVAVPARPSARLAASSGSSAQPLLFSSTVSAKQFLAQIATLAQGGSPASRAVATAAASTAAAPTEKTTKPLDVVFVAAEVAPWSKTGGLGDVVGGLPIELAKRGHRVITIAPRYDQYADAWDTSVSINVDGEAVRFFHSVSKGVHRVWIDHPWFLAKVWGKTGSKLYGPKSGADYLDNHKRFALFNKAAIEAVKVLPFGPGEDCVFVANDWHSALLPVLIKDVYQPKGQFKNAKVALVIHNIAFQGRMWQESFKDMGLPESSFKKLEFQDGVPKVYTELTPMKEDEILPKSEKKYKKINWLKAGILAADKVLTVSPNYATEITADEAGGVELHNFLRASPGGVEGIVNGMDIEEWNPKKDKYLPLNYDDKTVHAGKAAAKEALQAELGLPVDPSAPLFAFIGRLEEQKGVDILLAALPKIVANGKSQVAILGTGKAKLEKDLAAISTKHKGQAKGIVKFSAPLAHMITAGADFILVPSRFEPCGLIQLHAMHYGTVPIVSSTGGLVDTVKEGVTGFHIGKLDPDTLLEEDVTAVAETAARAAEVYGTPLFKTMVENCISQDLSWNKPAKKWEGVLEELVQGKAQGSVTTAATAKKESVLIPVAEKIPGDAPAVTRSSSKPVGASQTNPIIRGVSKPSTAAPTAAGPGPRPAAASPKVATAAPKLAPVSATVGADEPSNGAASNGAASNGAASNGAAEASPVTKTSAPKASALVTSGSTSSS